ncbi:protein BatD [candidate division KSB1 bacterium]|nr:protein BatD [candidate division KSB1 bacterium]
MITPNIKISLRFLFILLISANGLSMAQQSLTIRAVVDRTTLALNQRLMLTIEISGEGANKVDYPPPPEMGEFLKLAGSGGNSQNIQFINGKMSITKSQAFYYIAAKEGTYTIPEIRVSNKDNQAVSEPVTITIVKSAVQPDEPQKQTTVDIPDTGEDLYLRAIVSKKTVYQNEPVVVSYRIYKSARVNLTNYGVNKLPETVGFWAEEIDVGNQPKIWEEVINGQKFVLADIKKTILFPASPGEKSVGSLGIDCNIRVPRQRRSNDIFDSFFEDPFFTRTVRKTIFSQPVKINVLPLPTANKPENFSGIVGNFDLDASIDKSQVKTNEAITLKIKISGTGNIKIVPQPNVLIPQDFQQYEPKITENIIRNENGVSGNKTFEYILVPRFPGEQRIKSVNFNYFDPYAKTYKTLSTPEFLIRVEKGNDELLSMGSGLSKEEVRLVGQDIRYIKLNTNSFTRTGFKIYKSFLYVALCIIPMLLLIVSVGYNRHLEKLSKNVAYARSRRANTIAMKRLSKSRGLLAENTQKEFFAEVSRALLGFAADKLNLAAAGMISTELEELLNQRNLDSSVVNQYIELIQTCDFQRFAPATVTKAEMFEFYSRAKEAIVNLEKAL